jgi:hypothetical protein
MHVTESRAPYELLLCTHVTVAARAQAKGPYLVKSMVTMREVESSDGHARLQQLAALLNAAGRRPKSAHYLEYLSISAWQQH